MLQEQRTAVTRRLWWPHAEAAGIAAAAALGMWLVEPSLAWALAGLGLSVWASLLAAREHRGLLLGATAVAVIGGMTAATTSGRVRRIEKRWPEVREQLIGQATSRLAATLQSTVSLARSLADRGATVAGASESSAAAFEPLRQAVGRGGVETGVVIVDSAGQPWSWAGRHRLPPVAPTRELYARITPFYVVLEARRQSGERVAIGHVLLAADSAVPDREASVAARFGAGTGGSLEFYAPGGAPERSDVADVSDYCLPSCVPDAANPSPDTLFSVRTAPPAQGTFKLSVLAAGGRTVAIGVLLSLVLLIAAGNRRTRYLALGLIGVLFLFTPAGQRLGLERFFSPATYYLPALDPLTSSAGALALTAVVAIAGIVMLRTRPLPRTVGLGVGALVLVLAPLAARLLAGGISPPPLGLGAGLWLAWEVPIAAGIAAMVLLVAALLPPLIAPRRWVPWAAMAWSIATAMLGLAVWRPEAGLPTWFVYLWIPAVVLVAQSGTRSRQVIAGAVVAGSAAAILTWAAAADGRLRLARADVHRLGDERDPAAIALLERFGQESMRPPRNGADLYAAWQRSSLATAGYPAVLALWGPGQQLVAELPLANLDVSSRLLQAFARSAAEQHRPLFEVWPRIPGSHVMLARPFADGTVVTVGIGPKTRLLTPLRLARVLLPQPGAAAPYDMALSAMMPDAPVPGALAWRRAGQVVEADEVLTFPGATGQRHLRVSVDVGDIPGLLIRGALLLVVDAVVVAILWLLGEALLGRTGFLQRLRLFLRPRSYRVRIAVALAVFFIVPTVGFSAWMAGRLQSDAVRSQDLVIRQSLRDAGAVMADDRLASVQALTEVADRVGGELLLYRNGALQFASAPLLAQLGLVDALLAPAVYRGLAPQDGGEALGNASIAGRDARVGYRALGAAGETVLAMPRFPEERPTAETDLAYALLLATLVGLGAAAAFARTAARSLSEPVGVLRRAAEVVGRGGTPPPFDASLPEEFGPVADAFARMAHDVRASQDALESARRRTVTVLRNVATGVLALTDDLKVTLANPRAEELLGASLPAGTAIETAAAGDWMGVWTWVREFLRSGAELSGQEVAVGGRRLRMRASTLGGETAGCVVALDDVTELTHAVRVLAWGDIARQVAHEIKNPLTPMRLGVQHLRRAYEQPKADFEQVLARTADQILAEIDRLDAVARAFSRFGAPPAQPDSAPAGMVDLVAIARETAALYAIGGGSTEVRVATAGVVEGIARPDELREVLVNLVENARNAAATRIALTVNRDGGSRLLITVRDNGRGIPGEVLPRIFEPHFSTTTSGTGLGLAICRRLVESWGGKIFVESTVGEGTTVTIETVRRSDGQTVNS